MPLAREFDFVYVPLFDLWGWAVRVMERKEQRVELYFLLMKGLVPKETVVSHQWGSETLKFGIKQVDTKCQISTIKK